ncbi:MAG: hypothetical protein KGH84_07375, partial [Paracoccaceae bacterium]|nr:hypothetical protein [Paracoccaceae bacterium]
MTKAIRRAHRVWPGCGTGFLPAKSLHHASPGGMGETANIWMAKIVSFTYNKIAKYCTVQFIALSTPG